MSRWFTNPYVIVVAAISLTGIAVSGLLFLLIPPPEEVLATSRARFFAAKSVHAEIRADWRGSNPETGTYSSSMDVDSAGASVTEQSSFDLKLGEQRFVGEHRAFGGTDFVYLDESPSAYGPLQLADLRDTWLRIDVQTLAGWTALPFVGGNAPMTAANRAAFKKEAARTPFFQLVRDLGAERLDGIDMHHYAIRPEPLLLKDLYFSHERARLGREPSDKERASADRFFADLDPQDGEIWIAKRDSTPRRIRLRFAYDSGVKRKGMLDVEVRLSAYNVPVAVKPVGEDALDATPIFQSILLALQDHLPLSKDGAPARIATERSSGLPVSSVPSVGDRDTDGDGLADVMEHFYGSDPSNPDTDGDGVQDGAEVAAGKSPTGPGWLFDFFNGAFE